MREICLSGSMSGHEIAWIAIVSNATKPLRHAVARHHRARDVGDTPQIIGGAGRQMPEHDELCGAASEKNGHLVFELFARHQEAILYRALNGVAERADTAWDDGDLVHSVGARQGHRDQRVPHLVMATISRSLGLSRRLRFSRPATMRSTALVKSAIVTASPPRRVANSVASLTRLARSAPVKPGVSAAIFSGSTSLASFV